MRTERDRLEQDNEERTRAERERVGQLLETQARKNELAYPPCTDVANIVAHLSPGCLRMYPIEMLVSPRSFVNADLLLVHSQCEANGNIVRISKRAMGCNGSTHTQVWMRTILPTSG